jgi:membrane-associated phospholipid phosphatase
LWRRGWLAAVYWLAALGGASLIGLVIKVALHRPRPAPVAAGWDAFSFPSGHATTSAAIYGFLAFILARDAQPRWQAAIAVTAAIMIALIGFSRLYLGAHWFSDVIGGIAFGTAWIALLAIPYMRHNPPELPAMPLGAIAVVTIMAVGSFQVTHRMSTDLERYAVRPIERTMTLASWWQDGWQDIPRRRVDLIGEQEESFFVQWGGSNR